MSAARAIQVSVTQLSLGVLVGSAIEGVLPRHTDGVSVRQLLFETLIQTGLNGAALALLAPWLQNDDPTYGIPFAYSLFWVQSELGSRILTLASAVKGVVAQGVQRTGPLAQAVLPATSMS